MVDIDELIRPLDLEPIGSGQYRAGNVDMGAGVIFGGQLLAQSLMAAADGHDDKSVKTLHTVFARGGKLDSPVAIAVEPLHSGRSFATSTVTISQGDRVCVRSQVLLSADERNFISHADRAPAAFRPPGTNGDADGGPAASGDGHGGGAWQIRVVDDVDVGDPELTGPPDLDVWTRFDGAPEGRHMLDQALLAFATDGFLIGAAMRPHPGVGQSQAHVSVSTGVVSHTLTFHEPFSAGEWLLLAQHSPYAGRGRTYGRGDVFREDGALVASFVQDAMVRPMPSADASGGQGVSSGAGQPRRSGLRNKGSRHG